KLIHRKGLPLETGFTYAVDTDADASASNIRIENDDFYFDFKNGNVQIADIKLGIPGMHNIENATAAIEAALLLDVPVGAIKSALGSFKGVKRRFEYIIKKERQVF